MKTVDTFYGGVKNSKGELIFSGQALGNPIPALRATNQYTGLYALDTFDVTNAFSITAGGRFNNARIALVER